MKKYTKITPENIHLIGFRIKQFLERFKYHTTQSFYDCKYVELKKTIIKNSPNMDAFDKILISIIEKSLLCNLGYSNLEIEKDRITVRVNLPDTTNTVFHLGDKIKIDPCEIKIYNKNIVRKIAFKYEKIPLTVIKGTNVTQRNVYVPDYYSVDINDW